MKLSLIFGTFKFMQSNLCCPTKLQSTSNKRPSFEFRPTTQCAYICVYNLWTVCAVWMVHCIYPPYIYMLIFWILLDRLKHTPEEHSSMLHFCTTRKCAKRKRSDDNQPTDWKPTASESKLRKISESEGLTDSDFELPDNIDHSIRVKYQ